MLFGLFGVTGLVEHSLYGGWNRTYYTLGLPFIALRIPVANCRPEMPPPQLLQNEARSSLIGSLVFQPVTADIYGFRRRFFQSAWVPNNLMHGMLQFDRQNHQVVLKAFINTLALLLVLAIAAFCLLVRIQGWARLLPLGILGIVVAVPLLLERRRLLKLARFAASAWSMNAESQSP